MPSTEAKNSPETDFDFLIDNDDQTDEFGHDAIISTLESTLKKVPSPFTIGVIGEWGIGKSFVLNGLKKRLENSENSKEYKVFFFDAWKHSGEPVKRALLTELLKEGKRSETEIDKWMHRLYFSRQEPQYPVGKVLNELMNRRGIPSAILIFIALFAFVWAALKGSDLITS